jgi:hypothetical protein
MRRAGRENNPPRRLRAAGRRRPLRQTTKPAPVEPVKPKEPKPH